MEKNIISTEAKIEELGKNKALVSYKDGEKTKKVVAKIKSNKQVGDAVILFKDNKYPLWARILFVLLPIVLFLSGFGFGFFFNNDVYHYVLAASLGALGFLLNVFIILGLKKYSKLSYFCE